MPSVAGGAVENDMVTCPRCGVSEERGSMAAHRRRCDGAMIRYGGPPLFLRK